MANLSDIMNTDGHAERCVKCGQLISSDVVRTDRWCAPCCDNCKAAVIKETRKNYTMWPSDWRGGWLWHRTQWERVIVYSDQSSGGAAPMAGGG